MAENHLDDEALPKARVERAQLLAEVESKAGRCLLHGSILSRVGVSSKPGAIQFEFFVPAGQTGNNIYDPASYPVPSNIPSFSSNACLNTKQINTTVATTEGKEAIGAPKLRLYLCGA